MTQATSVATTLRKAAQWLEEHDWCQGVMGHRYGTHSTTYGSILRKIDPTACCAIGAIVIVADDYELHWARLVLGRYVGNNVSSWNDAPGRTKAEVIAAMRAAADAEEAA
jgi:hypothetical protein